MSFGPHHLEVPMAIIGAVVTGVCSAAVVVWQWGCSLAMVDAVMDQSALISAIVVLFGSLSAIVVWVGTKFLEASRLQSEANNKMADALSTFTERFDGPIMEMFSNSINHAYQQGVNQHSQTLGASPSHQIRRKQG